MPFENITKRPLKQRRELTDIQKGAIIGMKLAGETDVSIHKSTGINRRTINYLWNKYKKTGSTNNTQRSGRPPKLTKRD